LWDKRRPYPPEEIDIISQRLAMKGMQELLLEAEPIQDRI
jgi:hypothetical protein